MKNNPNAMPAPFFSLSPFPPTLSAYTKLVLRDGVCVAWAMGERVRGLDEASERRDERVGGDGVPGHGNILAGSS